MLLLSFCCSVGKRNSPDNSLFTYKEEEHGITKSEESFSFYIFRVSWEAACSK